MDVVGSEIGQKMRSAIKAKLTELGCYVDDELPDYVMVMVANKRTRAQMEEDLQLFLGDNTDLFVNWLHQVLKKLQEVTVTAPLIAIDVDKKERSQSKERKSKEKKDKEKVKKSDGGKKAKKKDKEKFHKKKDEKKGHKNKKKSKHHEMIRPNVPPLLMNIEKESEPSITDVFAGQILKNHGISLDDDKHQQTIAEQKNVIKETKRPILPVIDPSTISSQPVPVLKETSITRVLIGGLREDQIKEMHEIETKISGLKQKLADQLESMSDDEDFLNIRTEAEELMNDFAEDVYQEVSQSVPVATPPLVPPKSPTPPPPPPLPTTDTPEDFPKPPETLPHIELNLPKRPVRDRLGVRESSKEEADIKEKEKVETTKPPSPERFTPERQPVPVPSKSAKTRLGGTPEPAKGSSTEDANFEKNEQTKRLTSKVSVLENRPARSTCASVVRVRPRPRVTAPASNLLLKAVADAHKSLLNAPPKIEIEPPKPKRALVLPMRRCVEAQKILIQVPRDVTTDTQNETINNTDLDSDGEDKTTKPSNDTNKKEFPPMNITKVINNTDYIPNRATSQRDDTLVIETINIHNPTVDKDRDTQFIVTMDGYLPNAFLAKKLMMEGLLDDEDMEKNNLKPAKSVLKTKDTEEKTKEKGKTEKRNSPNKSATVSTIPKKQNVLVRSSEQKKLISDSCEVQKKQITNTSDVPKKRLSDTSEDSDTQVIIKQEEEAHTGEKRKVNESISKSESSENKLECPPIKKRKASPIVFNVERKEKERVRERTQSASSDTHVTVSTTINTHKYDSVPTLSQAERKLVWCRSFPLCRFGAACAFAHPRCKFAAACTRRGCVYSHAPNAPTPPTTPPILSSHVVPAANYKSISAGNVANMCRFYPNCVNPTCHYYHPKPCRYGKTCTNKLECNFYHNDAPSDKWKYVV
ncbi:zinc finger CCCH domain-containing protein 14 [Battus philenor]|uniref:zinc finger CCCH domain-containing protein 14 n=1 Tax=Battus philenor TaxID=42288 RepID=UPI0035CEE03F